MQQLRPTFSESWYRVADLKARLRGSAQISRQYYRGERWYVVRDPAGNQYHRLSSAAYRFVGLLDGSRTVSQAWDLVGGQLADDAPTQPEVIQILSQLHAANLLEANITADASILLRRHKRMRTRQLQGRLMNVLFPRIPLWDPDRFLCKWMPVMRLILSLLGWVLWFTVVIGAIVVIAPRWNELRATASKAIDPSNWPYLWATFVLIKLIHELGHGFICRRFGGEIHELGVMFLVFVPAPYVDASSAWSLPNRWHRALVGAGGMIFELFVAGLMVFVWANTREGLVNHLAYNAMLIASVSTIIFNANPLLRYDGYYILSDLLEIPNLQQKANEYTLGLIKRHVFRVKSPLPLPPPGQRVWLFFYSITAGIYRIFVGLMIIFIVIDRVPVLGVLMALGGVITWAVVPIYKIFNYLLLDAELHRKRVPAMAFVLAVCAAIVVIVGFIPTHVHYDATAVLLPREKCVMHADTPGFVIQILKHDGDLVKAGDAILICENLDEQAQYRSIQDKIAVIDAQMQYEKVNHPEQLAPDVPYREGMVDDLKLAQQRIDALVVRAPIDGLLIAPDLMQKVGQFVQKGQELGITVAQIDHCVADGFIDERDMALPFIRSSASRPKTAEIRLAGAVGTKLKGTVEAWGAAAIVKIRPDLAPLIDKEGGDLVMNAKDPSGNTLDKPQYPVRVDFDNTAQRFYPGQKAYLRFDLGKKPLIWQWYRRLGQLLQTHSSTSKWL